MQLTTSAKERKIHSVVRAEWVNSEDEDASLGWILLKRNRFVNVNVPIALKERNYVLVLLRVFLLLN